MVCLRKEFPPLTFGGSWNRIPVIELMGGEFSLPSSEPRTQPSCSCQRRPWQRKGKNISVLGGGSGAGLGRLKCLVPSVSEQAQLPSARGQWPAVRCHRWEGRGAEAGVTGIGVESFRDRLCGRSRRVTLFFAEPVIEPRSPASHHSSALSK